MDINKIEKQTEAAINELMEKPGYISKHKFLEEYNAVTRELGNYTAQMNKAAAENKFDEAVKIKNAIAVLEQRKEIMEPILQEKQAQKDFDDLDLIAINEEVLNIWKQYIEDGESKMRKLLRECQQIQTEMNVKQREIENCREMLLARSATGYDFKTKVKFRQVDAQYTFFRLVKDLAQDINKVL